MSPLDQERLRTDAARDQCRAVILDSLADIQQARLNMDAGKLTDRDILVIRMVLNWAEGEALFMRAERTRGGT